MNSVFAIISLSFLLFTPLLMQNSGWAFDIPRVLSGVPLILVSIIFVKNWSSLGLTKKQKWLFFISVLFFLTSLVKGYLNSNVSLIGILAYTRSYWVFILAFCLGVFLAKNKAIQSAKEVILFFFVVSIPILLFEYIFKTDAAQVLGYIKLSGMSPEAWDGSHSKPFFNLKSFDDLVVYRPTGPTGSTISYAYVLMSLPLLFPIYKFRFYVSILISFLLCLILGSKGGVINIIMLSVFLFILKFTSKKKNVYTLAVLMPCLLSFVQVITGDNHGLGLAFGFGNLLSEPLGHGLGFGGNLSGEYFNQSDDGRSLVYGSESIFGVYMTQVGFPFFIQLGLVLSIITSSVKDKNTLIFSVVCMQIVFLGLAQEEAWSTYSSIPFILLGMSTYSSKKLSQEK
ncbi:TPA: hypothetical protein KDX54_004468 [Vibrio vulnificus]|nr:hypothetical protein [Vibrio vulnificus]